MMYLIRATFLLLLTSLATSSVFAESIEDSLLAPEQAFKFQAKLRDAETIVARWQIADGYYLYRDAFEFFIDTPGYKFGESIIPDGKIKKDEFFGEIETYRGEVEILLPITVADDALGTIEFRARAQGCADLGVCYPPQDYAKILVRNDSVESAPAKASPSNADFFSGLSGFIKGSTSGSDDLMDPEQAFQVSANRLESGKLQVEFDIEPGHYLYKNKLGFAVLAPVGVIVAEPVLPAGKAQEDEFFGKQEILDESFTVELELSGLPPNTPLDLEVKLQGCAKSGVCYPPGSRSLVVPAGFVTATAGAATAEVFAPAQAKVADASLSASDEVAKSLSEGGFWFSLVAFFGFGLLLAATPCVFPMIPILSGLIVGQGAQLSRRSSFMLSVVFVLAMAATYAVLGVIAGASGANLQAVFQQPIILYTFAGVFVLLALSMFGLYDLQLPVGMQNKLASISQRKDGGSLLGAAIMGFFSAIIVGPCVTPPLVGALVFISQSGDALQGGLALFSMGLGMGVPLLILGASAGSLLPRAGAWMDAVKAVFGVLLLAVALWLLERVVPFELIMVMAGVLLIVSGVYMGALDNVREAASGWRRLWKGLGLIGVLYGALLVVGAASGGHGILQPLKGVIGIGGAGNNQQDAMHSGLVFERIKSIEDLNAALARARGAQMPVMLDFYADWCVACKEMEAYTFTDRSVQNKVKDVMLIQADLTDYDAIDKALAKHVDIYGPPAILFFDRDGIEIKSQRVFGYMKADAFTAHIEQSFGLK